MNDAERDAWLREALRHAPDADAAPPSGVSETILAKARAHARAGTAGRRARARADPRAGFAALWHWLARPPVAAGFASVMAATLVGLMWWDQPMDETMPRRPPVAAERDAAPPLASTAPATVAAPRSEAAKSTLPAPNYMTSAPPNATAKATDDGDLRRRRREATPSSAADAKETEPGAAAEKRKIEALAKERAPATEAKNEAPAPFPAARAERQAQPARRSLDAPASEIAKKSDAARSSRATDAVDRNATPPAAQSPAPSVAPSPAPALAARPPAASVTTAPAAPAPTTPTPTETTAAPFGNLAQRQRALGELRDKDAVGAGAAAPRDETTRTNASARDEAMARADKPAQAGAGADAAAAPLARVLAAIAADRDRWSRRTAAGDGVSLEPAWRQWLAELDAAAAGRWRRLDGGAGAGSPDAASDGATTLRLVEDGRLAAIVRIAATTVQVDAAPGTTGERWQAALKPADAERLRTTARRLAP